MEPNIPLRQLACSWLSAAYRGISRDPVGLIHGLILDDPPGPKEAQNDGSSPQNRGTGTGSCPAVQHGMANHGGTAGLRCQVLKGRKGASKVRLGCLEIVEPRKNMDPDGPGMTWDHG